MRKAKILVVDDEKDVLSGLNTALTKAGFEVKVLDSGEKVAEAVKQFSPDLILLDVMLGDISGFEVKDRLNKNITTARIPVVYLTVNNTLENKRRGLKTGANDYIVKPFDIDELIVRIESILTRKNFYENMYMRDVLTGLYNKSHFEKQAKILYNLSMKYSRPFSIAVFDIDSLKKINDVHGRAAGDYVLKSAADILTSTIRSMDIAIRYAGDEFVVLLPETNNEQARTFICRVKAKIHDTDFTFNDKKIDVRVNTGSTTCFSGELDLEDIFRMVDLNMYVEKNRDKKIEKKSVLIIEDEKDIASGVKKNLEIENFSVLNIINTFDDAVNYINKSKKEPAFVILDLDLGGKLSPDFLGLMYSKWKNTKVFIFTAFPEYMETYPYFKDIVTGFYDKSQLPQLIASIKDHLAD